MIRKFCSIAAVLAFGLVFTGSARAQSLVVSGVVTDEKGAVIEGVSVTLRNPSGQPTAATTGKNGDYKFDGLKPGPYEVTFARNEYKSEGRTLTLTDASKTVDISLGLGVVTTSVDVIDSADLGAASRMYVSDRIMPMQVSVITQQTLREQNINDLATALENVSGVTTQLQYGSMEWYTIGGITQQSGNEFLLIDGMSSTGNRANTQLNNIERIEVIKGPASILYGSSSASSGGQINVVRKQPQATRQHELLYRAGRWGLQEVGGGSQGEIFGLKRLQYRADVQTSRQDGFRQNGKNRFNATPQILWLPTDRIRLKLVQGLSHDDYAVDAGIPQALYHRVEFPRDRKFNPPGEFDKYRDWQTQVNFEMRITDRITLQHFFFTQIKHEQYLDSETMGYVPASNTVTRSELYFLQNIRPKQNQTVLLGNHSFLGIRHKWQVAFDLKDHHRFTYRQGTTTNSSQSITLPAVDVAAWLQPGYVDPAVLKTEFPRSRVDFATNTVNALTLNDVIEIGDRLAFNVLWSRSAWKRRTHNDSWNPATDSFVSRGAETLGRDQVGYNYRAGVSYTLANTTNNILTAYFNSSSNFQPILSVPATVDPTIDLLPQTTRVYEFGAKWSTLRNRLNIGAGLGKKTLFNLIIPISTTVSEQAGESAAKTADVDVEGTLGWGLRATASYGYTDAHYVKFRSSLTGVNSDFGGRKLQFSAKHAARAYLTKGWSVLNGKRITASFGGTIRSKTYLNTNSVPTLLGGWTRFDGGASFEAHDWSAAVNVQNLFNRERYAVSQINSGSLLYPGTPFAATLTLRYTFNPRQ